MNMVAFLTGVAVAFVVFLILVIGVAVAAEGQGPILRIQITTDSTIRIPQEYIIHMVPSQPAAPKLQGEPWIPRP